MLEGKKKEKKIKGKGINYSMFNPPSCKSEGTMNCCSVMGWISVMRITKSWLDIISIQKGKKKKEIRNRQVNVFNARFFQNHEV